jgi:hypothetical protein
MRVPNSASFLRPVPLASLLLAIGFGACTQPSQAQLTTTYEEQSKLMRAPKAYASIGADLFGDTVNLSNGTLQFRQTDVSVKGNDALAVSVGRRFTVGTQAIPNRAFGRWNIDIPHIHGIFSYNDGWTTAGNVGGRCTNFGPPNGSTGVSPAENGNGPGFEWDEFWQGTSLYTPEGGDQQMLRRAAEFTISPSSPADYPVVTTAFWAISCLSALANPSATNFGEGFMAVSPAGISYRFDWMASYQGPTLQKAGGNLSTREIWILPTVVTDRFGNWVRYSYDPANPNNLTKIEASDGRVLDLTYYPASQTPRYPYRKVHTVSDGQRTWTYNYDSTDLVSVALPDNSAWTFANSEAIDRKTAASPGDCDTPPQVAGSDNSWSMTHPSGATGTFRVNGKVHGRSDVIKVCDQWTNWIPQIARYYATQSLVEKTISGPGIDALTWSYDYGPANGSWAPCDASCIFSKTVRVTDPVGKETRYTFGTRFQVSDGRLEAVDQDGLRTTVTQYRPYGAGPYPDRVGYDDSPSSMKGDGAISNRLAPVARKTITQQGVDFIWEAGPGINGFDEFARPKTVTRSSSLGSRTEVTTYSDNLAKWVLGQVGTVTSGGKTMVENSYNPSSALLQGVKNFGLQQQTMTYYADGTLATKADGLGQTTTFTNYKRGIPQNARYADGSTESAQVNNDGTIDWIVDANSFKTSFGYDPMGRLNRIVHPTTPGGLAWNDTTITFAQIASDEFGVGPGHWRQDIDQGNSHSSVVLDALWRPVFSQTYDANNVAASISRINNRYDHAGRTTFASYPARDFNETGVTTIYDALGRVTQVLSASELGTLSTVKHYDAGFRTVVRDNRSNATMTSFQAFDTPSEEAITGIIAPEGLVVAIDRDNFGKPRSITRSGNGVSATRSYVYDDFARLCKTIEPETGATLQQLDAANNVSWRAPGMNLPSTNACDLGSVPQNAKISFGYDNMNRLRTTGYGDGSAAIVRDYWADGQPKTVASSGAVWTMNYNERRLPTIQSLAFEGQTFTFNTSYNANGHPVQLDYPTATNAVSNRSVSYDPDALGRPTHIGPYATGITYHPSGAIGGFTYGNGKVRSMTQNTRGLPRLTQDGGVIQDQYHYDQNGNVTMIDDQINAGPDGTNTSRAMEYDGLDRLRIAKASGIWGDASYAYDALDNIRTSTIGGRVSTYNYNVNNTRNLLDSLQSTADGFTFNYTYDNRGNATSRGTQTFGFDLGNRLTTAANFDTYVYDGFGRRVKTSALDGTVTISVYSPAGQLLYTRRTGGLNPAQSTQYIYLHNHQIAEVKK